MTVLMPFAARSSVAGDASDREASRPRLGRRSDGVGEYVDALEQALHPGVRAGNGFRQIVVELQHTAIDAGDAPDKPDTDVAQHTKVEIAPLGPADELHRRLPPGSFKLRGRDSVIFQDAVLVQPPHDVAPAVETRQPRVPADRDRHLSTGPLDLLGKLHAGSRGADDEHAAVRQFGGIAIGRRRHLMDRWRQISAPSRAQTARSQWPVAITTHCACQTPRSLSTR